MDPVSIGLLAAKFGPAILGGLSSLFGKGGQQGVPDWLQPYLDDYMKNVVGGYDSLIGKYGKTDKVTKGLKQEAFAAMGKGKYAAAGFGPIGQQVLDQLRAKQATNAKASDRQTTMGYASAGIGSGILPAVLAQQRNEREQGNEIANSQAISNVSLNSITGFQNAKRAQADFLKSLHDARGSAYGRVLSTVAGVGSQPQGPGMASRILGGIGAAAGPILSGLGGGEDLPEGSGTTPGSMIPNLPPTLTPGGGLLNSSLSELPNAAGPGVGSFDEWWKKYGAGLGR